MSLKELFSGIAIIIDDEVNKPKANIANIIKQVENQNIPVLKYDAIPSDEVVNHFKDLSFLLLDWRLIKDEVSDDDISSGVSIPDGLEQYDIKENIEFIKKLKGTCFCPIFIFTNEDVTSIQAALKDAGLYNDDRPNYICIKSKSEIK